MKIYFAALLIVASFVSQSDAFSIRSVRPKSLTVSKYAIRPYAPRLLMSSDAVSIPTTATPEPTEKPVSALWKLYLKTTDTLTVLFPLWTVLFAGLALFRPESFAWFSTKYFTATLGALMLSMGITLTPDDFTRVAQQPYAVIVGFILCYVMCPLLGLGLGQSFKLPIDLIAGLVLVGSINGGQASNLCTYIAKGDVALSVLMTTVTTIAGIVATPLLCKLLLGAVVPVDAVGIAVSCLQVVLAPIVLGMSLNRYLPKVVEKMLPATPVVGVFSTCLLVASAVAQCAPAILNAGWRLQIPVMLLHLVGGIAGYWIPKKMKFTEVQCRTMAIETAMKSSAFGFLLAKLHFKQYATRVPSAVSVVWMALVGAILAVVWRFIPVKEEDA
jgi:bile acid:Na+ symporter, BASS family